MVGCGSFHLVAPPPRPADKRHRQQPQQPAAVLIADALVPGRAAAAGPGMPETQKLRLCCYVTPCNGGAHRDCVCNLCLPPAACRLLCPSVSVLVAIWPCSRVLCAAWGLTGGAYGGAPAAGPAA